MRKLADRELRLIARPKRKDLFRAQSIPFLRPDRKTKFLTCRFQSASYSLTPFAALFPHFSPSLPAARRREAKGRWRHLSDRRRRKKRARRSPCGPSVFGDGWFFTKQKRSRRNAKGAAPKNFLLLFSFFPCTCIILHFSKEKRPMTQKALLPPQEEISSGGRRLKRRRPRIFPRKSIRQGGVLAM